MMLKSKDNDLINYFFESLPHYLKSIDCLEDRLSKKGNQTSGYIYGPIIHRQFRNWELDYLKNRGNDVTALEQAIAPLDARFRQIRDEYKKEYLRQMLESFHKLIQDYHPEFALEDDYYFENFLERTDDIEAIRGELASFIDINIECDEIRKKLDLFIRYIPEAIKQKTYSPNDLVEAPPEIWWRHLEEKYGERVD